ncbi:hypothetical protein [Rhodohalobacter mucosus]|uniref:Uncharacterized protein n=1 Tax=Rhodohalobacter mucosus TaxID=2079485 RepID=A0A316TUI8_9BACT|nr:hypothetical protein [Rhodohalobacter mucosus]PWN06725.1 hypothetical protein DDZ15_09425 [Rhodohalobacter mucosus]
MEPQEEANIDSRDLHPDKSGKKISSEMFIAVFAIVISLSTLFVYIYQSNLMKQQQKMSVWPHLTIGPSVSEDAFTLRMMNQGIGPAIIETVQLTHDGDPLDGIQDLMTIVPDSLQSAFSYSSLWTGQVIMAGEPVDLFSVSSSGAAGFLAGELGAGRILLEVCYSSVYGDTWVTNGLQVEERECE